MQSWYYTDAAGQQTGPVSQEQLQQLAANGQINAQTNVWTEGMENWLPATQIQGLLPAAAVTANPYSPPQSQVAAPASSGDYPVPLVKKANFGLYLGLYLIGMVALVIGFVQNAASAPTAEDVLTNPNAVSESGNGGLAMISIGALLLLGSAIVRLTTLYRAWVVLQPATTVTTPGKAVGFLFIPFFNLYWIFIAHWKWACEWNRITASYSNTQNAPKAKEGLFLTAIILGLVSNLPLINLIAVIPALVLDIIMFQQICRGVNFMVSARTAPAAQATAAQGGIRLH